MESNRKKDHFQRNDSLIADFSVDNGNPELSRASSEC